MEEREREVRREQESGKKGGSAEAFAGVHPYYEPTVTAVTDMIVPATRIQWGPVFAGVLVALSVTFLWTALGIAVGIGAAGIGFWQIGFGAVGLFLGTMLAVKTAKADLVPALLHAVIIWSIALVLSVFTLGTVAGHALPAMMRFPGFIGVAATRSFGWWFFIGFIILLAASIAGALAGMVVPEHHEEAQS